MLLHVYATASEGKDITDEIKAIKARYDEIIKGLKLDMNLDEEFKTIEADFKAKAGKDYAASRGEFLNGKVIANYLGYEFIDSAEVIFFDEDGNFDANKTQSVLSKRLENLDCAVVAESFESDHILIFRKNRIRINCNI